MGTIQHDFVIAVAWDYKGEDAFIACQQFAQAHTDTYGCDFTTLLQGPFPGLANFYTTYVMVPDGSKEGWNTSDTANEIREFFIKAMTEAGANVAVGSFGEIKTSLVVDGVMANV